jgi:Zn-dependent alcohol dehydrogenase
MIPYLVEQNKQGRFPLQKLITYYAVEDHQRAFDDVKNGRTVKAVLRWTAD